jgi:hypothetical protein
MLKKSEYTEIKQPTTYDKQKKTGTWVLLVFIWKITTEMCQNFLHFRSEVNMPQWQIFPISHSDSLMQYARRENMIKTSA